MDFFTCKVRLSGSVLNEVPKINVTAPEIVMLRHLHGHDAVVGLKRTKSENVEHGVERERLSLLYGEKRMIEVFGQAHRELPAKLADYSEAKPVSAETIAGAEPSDLEALTA